MTAVAETAEEGRVRSQAILVGLVTVLVSGSNYAFSIVAVRLMSDRQYGEFASAQGLLLVLGAGCMAAIPWAISRHVVRNEDDPDAPSHALHFGLRAAAVQGVVMALISGAVLTAIGGIWLGVVTGASAFLVSMIAAPSGLLQGLGRLSRIGSLRLVEASTRIVTGLLLLTLVSRSSPVALSGFLVGSTVLLFAMLVACADAFPLRRGSSAVFRSLLKSSLSLGSVQILVAMLGSLDTIGVQFAALPVAAVASYQVASLLGRVPTYLSTALSLAYYQPLIRADDVHAGRVLRSAVSLYLSVSLALLLVIPTIPVRLVRILTPNNASTVSHLLWYTTISGILIGLADLLATAHQASGRTSRAVRVLAPGALLQLPVLVVCGRMFGVHGYAVALAVLSAMIAAAVLFDLRSWLPAFSIEARWVVPFLAAAAGSYVLSDSVDVSRHWNLYGYAVLVLAAVGFAGLRVLRRTQPEVAQ